MELVNYFDYRFNQPIRKPKKELPFITISRETGCGASKIAKLLVKELKTRGQKWSYVDKEILNESAKRLKIDKSKIEYVFDAVQKTHADEILLALSTKYYKSDKAVRKVIADVVKHTASEGNVIIVGRGGVSITSELKNGIHIRLSAPRDWRIESLMSRKKKLREDIISRIDESDKMRERMITLFKKDKVLSNQFDMEINCAKFTKQQIVELIAKVLDLKISV